MKCVADEIAIIGLGYVGLPLAVEFGKLRKTIGYDINTSRISELREGIDATLELDAEDINSAKLLRFTSNVDDIRSATIFIVTVPTPVDITKKPDLSPLINASKVIGEILKRDDIVIYESTVYPGATEEVCVPVLEEKSGLKFNRDFYCGYSPERINPGDKKNRLPTIKKIVSGSNEDVAILIESLYSEIIKAGVYRAGSIKIAEAAKVIENTQRDLNIALMNELSLIFYKLGIDTKEVLDAASTKWNFLQFKPGLVGGHCIGVDPYYLTHKAQEVGYHPEVILAGRRVNDSIVQHVADASIKLIIRRKLLVKGNKILVMGLTFKENCPDTRNSKVFELVERLQEYHVSVDVYDPWVNINNLRLDLGFNFIHEMPTQAEYIGIIVAVNHQKFIDLGIDTIKMAGMEGVVIFDVKNAFDNAFTDLRL